MTTDALVLGRPVDAAPTGGVRATAGRWLGALGRLGSRPRLLAGLLLLVGVALRLQDPAPIEMLRLQAFDLFQRVQPPAPAPRPVAIVDIDEQSLAELGQWPWPRNQIARLIQNLLDAGAVVVGFDVLFAESDRLSPALFAAATDDLSTDVREALAARPSNDQLLADLLREAPVVLGVSATHERDHPYADRRAVTTPVALFDGDPRPFLLSYGAAIHNVDLLEQAARGRGMITLAPERDGVVRRVPAVLRIGQQLYPTLALEMLRVAMGRPDYAIRSDPNGAGMRGVRIGRVEVPSDLHGLLWLRHAKHAPELYVPAAEIIQNRFDPELVRGKLVLVGTSAVGLRDLRATPIQASIPGVEIHAQLLETILAQDFLERPSYALGVELALALLLGALLIVAIPRLSALTSLAALLAFSALLLGGSWYLFDAHDLMLDGTYPTLTGAVLFLLLAYGNYSRAEAQRRQVRTAFSQFLAPALVERLVDHPEQLSLGGEVREMTFLFSDIAGFTSFTEGTDPAVLVASLNEYLDAMCQIVMDHGGTIDKIVGDAVHAIFNAPIDQPDHAARAVACALALDAFGQRFAEAKRRQGLAFGATRIGVNTGTAVIGNFGGARRFDYTAHGDAINTAARLESVNKHLGTRVCVAGATVGQCPELHFRPVGRLFLKGKTQGLDAFEPIAAAAAGAPATARYRAAFAALEADRPDAGDDFAQLAEDCPDDPLVALHARRLAAGERGVDLVMSEK